jgi:hypothetical protein
VEGRQSHKKTKRRKVGLASASRRGDFACGLPPCWAAAYASTPSRQAQHAPPRVPRGASAAAPSDLVGGSGGTFGWVAAAVARGASASVPSRSMQWVSLALARSPSTTPTRITPTSMMLAPCKRLRAGLEQARKHQLQALVRRVRCGRRRQS